MTDAAGESQKTPTVTAVGSIDHSYNQAPRRKQSVTENTGLHLKKLSLSFPVLRPNGDTTRQGHSPDNSTPVESARSSPRLAASTFPQIESPDFLTLLASQERKVLELRDELNRAENDLSALKKQWANFEASKKKSELRQIAKLQPLPNNRDDSEGENSNRERREYLQRKASKPARKSAQRVFSGSKHTRALSLLSPVPVERPMIRHSLDEITSSILPYQDPGDNDVTSRPNLERTNTNPSVETPKSLGKTYRDLTNRRSVPPPPSTDAIVRQGKQMASDLKEGLWTFFEDIRQATVGDEAVNGTQQSKSGTAVPRVRGVAKQKSQDGLRKKKKATPTQEQRGLALKDATNAHSNSKRESTTSFWKEFGMETPHKNPSTVANQPQQQQMLDDPLLDLNDVDGDDDEAWEAWESPTSKTPTMKQKPELHPSTQSAASNNTLPWPELTKLTPSKLKRTVSDIMKDWDSSTSTPESGAIAKAGDEGVTTESTATATATTGQQERRSQQMHHNVLASPHM